MDSSPLAVGEGDVPNWSIQGNERQDSKIFRIFDYLFSGEQHILEITCSGRPRTARDFPADKSVSGRIERTISLLSLVTGPSVPCLSSERLTLAYLRYVSSPAVAAATVF